MLLQVRLRLRLPHPLVSGVFLVAVEIVAAVEVMAVGVVRTKCMTEMRPKTIRPYDDHTFCCATNAQWSLVGNKHAL